MDPLIGRDGELADITRFLSRRSDLPAALLLTGDAGIGKTLLWTHALQAVAEDGCHILRCRPASSEVPLSLSALDDLLGNSVEDVLPALAEPRRSALEAALLRRPNTGPALDRRVLARGVLDAIKVLSDDRRLILALDDAQWMDPSSASVLAFCLRRLEREPVSILAAFRSGGKEVPLGLDRALPSDRVSHIALRPLSLGAIHEIIRSRLGSGLPRHIVTRLYDASGGNPFYALEIGRALKRGAALPAGNEPLPVPDNLSDLVRRRLRRLPKRARFTSVLVAASSGPPTERSIVAALDDPNAWAMIDQAIDAGILYRDGDRLDFTHPLLRSVLYADVPATERKDVHRRLAAIAEDPEERAWHVALGASRPSEETATQLDRAAEQAAARGAAQTAAALQEQAARLTPLDRPDARRQRDVKTADFRFSGGDIAESRKMVESALADSTVPDERALLLFKLAIMHSYEDSWHMAEQVLSQALEEAPTDLGLRSRTLRGLAHARLVTGDIAGALEYAHASLRSAESVGRPPLIAHSLALVAGLEFLGGGGARFELLQRAEALDALSVAEQPGSFTMPDPVLITALVLKWCDKLDEARPRLAESVRRALDRGEETLLPYILHHWSELESWAGNWQVAEEYALEGCKISEQDDAVASRAGPLYALALVRAYRGDARAARDIAAEALALCERTGNVPVTQLARSVLGFVDLSLGRYEEAQDHLRPLAEAVAIAGLREPSVVKFLPDEVECLVSLGRRDFARSLVAQLESQGRHLDRVWAIATGARCRALLAAADGDLAQARIAADRALAEHARLPMPFELGRTLLVAGTIERRARHRAAARERLGEARRIFESLGARLWVEKTRDQLAKLGVRVPTLGLTVAERRVAGLVIRGRTNREIAAELFVTENTIQTHVRHIFQKLGVRSRTELAATLYATSSSEAPDPQRASDITGSDDAGGGTSPLVL